MVKDKVYILVLTITKLDSSFVKQKFYIEDYCVPCRLHRNKPERGVKRVCKRRYFKEHFK